MYDLPPWNWEHSRGGGLYDTRKRTRLNAAMRCGCQIPQVFVSVTGVTDRWRHFLLIRSSTAIEPVRPVVPHRQRIMAPGICSPLTLSLMLVWATPSLICGNLLSLHCHANHPSKRVARWRPDETDPGWSSGKSCISHLDHKRI